MWGGPCVKRVHPARACVRTVCPCHPEEGESGTKGRVRADSDLPSRPLLLVARVFIEEAHPLTHRPIDTVGPPRPRGPWGEVGGDSQRRPGSRIRRGGAPSQGTYLLGGSGPQGAPSGQEKAPCARARSCCPFNHVAGPGGRVCESAGAYPPRPASPLLQIFQFIRRLSIAALRTPRWGGEDAVPEGCGAPGKPEAGAETLARGAVHGQGRLPGEAREDEEFNAWRKCFRQRAQLEQAPGGGRAGDAGSAESPGWERPAGALVRGRGSACRDLRPHPRGCGRGRPQTPREAAGVRWSLRALRLGPPRNLKEAAPSLQRSR